MEKTVKNQVWNFNDRIDAEVCAEVVSGSFEFEIDGVRRVIKPGDALLKRNDIEHGCVCLEDGILLDIFTPMRQEFV